MNWRHYTRLSYTETHEFSQQRSIVGIVLIVIVCLVAGIVILTVNGKLRTCIAEFKPQFETVQTQEGKEGCQGTTVSVGELLSMYSFTYVVAEEMKEYRNESLNCTIQSRNAVINLLSFAAPQFVWGYKISCRRPDCCCPTEIKKTAAASTLCFCGKNLTLRIQEFTGGYTGSNLLNASFGRAEAFNYSAVSNYSTLNNTISGITQRLCPNNNQITVLRFSDTTYSAYDSSNICSGKEGSTSTFEDPDIEHAVDLIKMSVDDAVAYDLKNFTVSGRNYMCYTCSRNHDVGQLFLNLLIAISAIGSVTYSLVLWLLKVTRREEPSTPSLAMAQFSSDERSI